MVFKASHFLTLSVLLSGCGGGGSSSAPASPDPTVNYTPQAFVNMDSIQNGTTVRFSGPSVQTDLTVNPGVAVTNLYNVGDTGNSTVDVTYDFNGRIIKLDLNHSLGTNLVFEGSAGDAVADASTVLGSEFEGILFATGDSGAKFGMAADGKNADIDFNYQTFGVWEKGRGTTSGEVVATSVGVTTVNVPASGSATFSGWTGGAFLDTAGEYDYLTASELTAVADFSARSVSITSENTVMYNMIAERLTTDPNAGAALDFTGTLTYSANSNSLSGSMTTTGGPTGTMTASFYGPNAEEIGGTFHGTGTGFELFTGSFGAKR
jgi:hypothetical protein